MKISEVYEGQSVRLSSNINSVGVVKAVTDSHVYVDFGEGAKPYRPIDLEKDEVVVKRR